MSIEIDIDARGMQCPWPALRLARAMRTRSVVVIVADDPIAPQEIVSLARERGWLVETVSTETGLGHRVLR